MRPLALIRDTMTVRFGAAVLLVAIATTALNSIFSTFGGAWGLPPIQETGLLNQAVTLLQVVDAAPAEDRAAMLSGITGQNISAAWVKQTDPLALRFQEAVRRQPLGNPSDDDMPNVPIGAHLLFSSASPIAEALGLDTGGVPSAYFLASELADQSWVLLSARRRSWGLPAQQRRAIELGFLVLSLLGTSLFATRLLARPINRLADGVRRFGRDPAAPPLKENGPSELRAVIRAFNDMQGQIQRFVTDRTEMLAAISHDLRTPLTRIRLRAELMVDEEQRRRLFSDVDDMQAMVDSALSFFRDDVTGEEATSFDLPELLQSITDVYNDHGEGVTYEGPSRIAYFGRPHALKRAIGNLVDNAIKYASAPVISLDYVDDEARIAVQDTGPGIPLDKQGVVFTPFVRLERSRNRRTGGVGLGLTAARSIVRAHGGDIRLRNRPTGGLEAVISLPPQCS